MKGILVVRKYKNRRLYDTERSRHVTREELLDIVRQGRDVQIQDASNGEDVTVETLLQIVLSEADGTLNTIIPPEFIHFLIRAKEGGLNRFFRDFLPGAMQTFQAGLQTLRNQRQRVGERLFPYSSMGQPWLTAFAPPPEEEAAEEEPAALDDMQRRLKELEDELRKLRKKR